MAPAHKHRIQNQVSETTTELEEKRQRLNEKLAMKKHQVMNGKKRKRIRCKLNTKEKILDQERNVGCH